MATTAATPRTVGRPEIGPAFSLRFPQDLLALIDAQAAAIGDSRAALIRRYTQRAATATAVDCDGVAVHIGATVELINEEGEPWMAARVIDVRDGLAVLEIPGYGHGERHQAEAAEIAFNDDLYDGDLLDRSCGCPAHLGVYEPGHRDGCKWAGRALV